MERLCSRSVRNELSTLNSRLYSINTLEKLQQRRKSQYLRKLSNHYSQPSLIKMIPRSPLLKKRLMNPKFQRNSESPPIPLLHPKLRSQLYPYSYK